MTAEELAIALGRCLQVWVNGMSSSASIKTVADERAVELIQSALAEREREIARLREALIEARDAWQEQVENDIDGCCPHLEGDTPGIYDGPPDESQMDEYSKPMIDETRALIARLNTALSPTGESASRA